MTCDELFQLLTDLLDGTLASDVEAPALEHLASCERCETTLGETRRLVQLAGDSAQVDLTDEARHALLGRIVDALREGGTGAT